jgi:hypothetical protein
MFVTLPVHVQLVFGGAHARLRRRRMRRRARAACGPRYLLK